MHKSSFMEAEDTENMHVTTASQQLHTKGAGL